MFMMDCGKIKLNKKIGSSMSWLGVGIFINVSLWENKREYNFPMRECLLLRFYLRIEGRRL